MTKSLTPIYYSIGDDLFGLSELENIVDAHDELTVATNEGDDPNAAAENTDDTASEPKVSSKVNAGKSVFKDAYHTTYVIGL